MKKIVFFFTALVLTLTAQVTFAQRYEVKGMITDSSTGEPVAFASVRVEGSMTGASADADGNYSISAPSGEAVLVFTFVGYKTATVPVRGRAVVDVLLEPDLIALQETIVVAFGTSTKESFTGSAKVVGSDDLAKSQGANVTSALAGAVPGVQLTSSSGAPGSQATIRIRGFSSLNAGNDPLIIVDGAPYSGDIGNINPSDVENITVLKDAASNALYGARGSNGVIMITTKKAKQGGSAEVTFDAKWGANKRALQHYDVITNPAQYYEMHYGALYDYYVNNGYSSTSAWQTANSNLFGDVGSGGLGYNVYTIPDGQYLIGTNGKLNPNATLGRIVDYNGDTYLLVPDDWEDVGTRTGFRQEYNLSINAANEKSTFYASLGYLDEDGITSGSDLERLTARMRADYQVKKWLKVGGNISYARFNGNSLSNNGSSGSTGNVWAFTSQVAPIYPAYIRNADGSIKVDSNGIQMMDYGNGTNAGSTRPFLSDSNAIQDNKLNTQNYEGNAVSANGFANINIIEGLTVTINGAFNLDETRYTYVYNPYYGQFDSTGGTVYKYHNRAYDYNLQQLINYSHTFNAVHNFEAMVGHEFYDDRYYSLYASKYNMFSQSNKELNGAVSDGQAAGSYKTRYNNEGYFGRIQYNYDERIFLSGSLRGDASSRFAPDYRWGMFWSLGAAWLLNKETWFNASWVDEFKLKASFGVQGNDNIGDYNYTDLYTISNSSGEVGTSFYSKGTEDITWETNRNFNVGAEFGLWNRLSGSLEYYYRKTTDMLYSFSVAPSLGYSSYYDNIGDMYNTGFELDLNANIFNTKNIRWDINLNLATLKNRITKLHEDKKTTTYYTASGKGYEGYNSGNFFIAEDLSIYTWYLKDYAGVSEDGQSMWYKNITDDDGNITGRETTTSWSSADYYVTEESTLPKVYGGFGTTVYLYGFDVSVNFTYQLGGKQYDSTYAYFMSSPTSSDSGYNFHKDLLKSWTSDNTDTDIPRFMYNDTYSAAASTRFLTSARYLNLQNVNVGYTFPSKWMNKLKINSLRLYFACENVYYWSARKGFDPRQSYTSSSNATRYSPMRTMSGGITVKF